MDLASVYRSEYGRCVATLVRLLGDIGLAEEAVQDAFSIALEKWTELPPNPGAWIVTTARNRAIDRIRRESTREARHEQALTEDTGGAVRPTFAIHTRPITALRRGDVIVEPMLGEVRVIHVASFGYDELRHEPLSQVHWVSDDGLSTAAKTFLAIAAVAVRIPSQQDAARIRRGIHLAARHRREIDLHTARLIAAHLQRGPGSALYAFAVSARTGDRMYQELDEVVPSRWPELNRWVNALANHCLNRAHPRRPTQGRPCRPRHRR